MIQTQNRKHNTKRNYPLTNLMKNTIEKIEREEKKQNFINKILNQYGNKNSPQKFHVKLPKSPMNKNKIYYRPTVQADKKNLQQNLGKIRLSIDKLQMHHKKISDRTQKQFKTDQIIIIDDYQKLQKRLSQGSLPLQSKIQCGNAQASNFQILINQPINCKTNHQEKSRITQNDLTKKLQLQLKRGKSQSKKDDQQTKKHQLFK